MWLDMSGHLRSSLFWINLAPSTCVLECQVRDWTAHRCTSIALLLLMLFLAHFKSEFARFWIVVRFYLKFGFHQISASICEKAMWSWYRVLWANYMDIVLSCMLQVLENFYAFTLIRCCCTSACRLVQTLPYSSSCSALSCSVLVWSAPRWLQVAYELTKVLLYYPKLQVFEVSYTLT